MDLSKLSHLPGVTSDVGQGHAFLRDASVVLVDIFLMSGLVDEGLRLFTMLRLLRATKFRTAPSSAAEPLSSAVSFRQGQLNTKKQQLQQLSWRRCGMLWHVVAPMLHDRSRTTTT